MANVKETYRTITPYLVVPNADAELLFLKNAFGGVEVTCQRNPDNTVMHAEVAIGDSLVMLGQASEQTDASTSRAIPLGRRCRRYLFEGARGRRGVGERARGQTVRPSKRRRHRPERRHLVDRCPRQVALKRYQPAKVSV